MRKVLRFAHLYQLYTAWSDKKPQVDAGAKDQPVLGIFAKYTTLPPLVLVKITGSGYHLSSILEKNTETPGTREACLPALL